LVWVGTDDGLIYMTRDDAKEWISVNTAATDTVGAKCHRSTAKPF